MLYLLIGIEHYKLQSGFIDTLFTYIYIFVEEETETTQLRPAVMDTSFLKAFLHK